MKLKIFDEKNSAVGEKQLPKQFEEEIREDVIQRAVLSSLSIARQPYGSKPGAGNRHSSII